MRIPFWQRDHAHPTKTIDRLQSHRSFRRVVGLNVANDYSKVVASLVLARGTGKHAKFKEMGSVETRVEDSVLDLIRELEHTIASHSQPEDSSSGNFAGASLKDARQVSESDIRFASTEISCILASCFRKLIASCGVDKNEVVVIGALDRGISLEDFDGNRYVRSLIDATELANRSSTSVIDRFRERDIVDGGTGTPLFPLGYWFLLADRNPKVAEENRLLLLNRDNQINAVFLPASDGLDSTLPQIEHSIFDKQNFTEDALESLLQEYRHDDSGLNLRLIAEQELLATVPYSAEKLRVTGVLHSCLEQMGYQDQSLDAVATAFLANAFVDQLPVSLPFLTGNQNPRVLGSMTPGSLVNFRRFVLETSKVTPAIMKLRDAI